MSLLYVVGGALNPQSVFLTLAVGSLVGGGCCIGTQAFRRKGTLLLWLPPDSVQRERSLPPFSVLPTKQTFDLAMWDGIWPYLLRA